MPTSTPTAVPLPTRTPARHRDSQPPAASGRITGTVIDLTTGAPATLAVTSGAADVSWPLALLGLALLLGGGAVRIRR